MRKVLYLFSELADADVDWFSSAGQTIWYAREDMILRQGDSSNRMFVILEGQVGIHVGSSQVARLGAGEVIGEMSFLDDRPASASAVALARTRVLVFRREDVEAHLQSNAAFAARFYRALALVLSDRVRGADVVMTSAGANDMRDEAEASGEMNPVLLERVHLAGMRFERLIRRSGL